MHTDSAMPFNVSDQEKIAALDKILRSRSFQHSKWHKHFLRYIVEATLAGQSANLKESVIGIEVFKRGVDFDPKIDSIVRVEAGRLRRKLSAYYKTDGTGDAVRIALPKGSYVPTFEQRPKPETKAKFSSNRHYKKYWFAGATVLLLLVGYLATNQASPERNRVAVLPFATITESVLPEDQSIAVAQAVRAALIDQFEIPVISTLVTNQYLQDNNAFKNINQELNVRFLILLRLKPGTNKNIVEAVLTDRDEKVWLKNYTHANLNDLAWKIGSDVGILIKDREKLP